MIVSTKMRVVCVGWQQVHACSSLKAEVPTIKWAVRITENWKIKKDSALTDYAEFQFEVDKALGRHSSGI